LSSDAREGAFILSDGIQILKEIDNQLNLGTLVDLGKAFLPKRDRKSLENLEQPIMDSGIHPIYNHWGTWRTRAELFVLKRWRFSKLSRQFRKGNQMLNQLFYVPAVSLGLIKVTFSEQLNGFRTLYEIKPPPWWRRIPGVLIEELIIFGLKLMGRSL